jgi:antitoxin (DNA-binding transcriptional repressor) of toxin-antitoxin stability system
MTAVPIADFAARPLEFLRRSEAGEQFEIVRDGQPVVHIGPSLTKPREVALPSTPESEDQEDEGERWWRGTYAPELPRKPIPGFVLPTEPIVVQRRLPEINTAWYPSHDDDEE